MKLRSVLEDFEANTLAAVPGLLGKLSYLGALHDGNGAYGHWGLEKVYGPEAMRAAINTSHRRLLSKILKTPLPVLLDDMKDSSASHQLAAEEFLFSLNSPQSLPKSPPPAAQVHFKSVLHALLALAASRHTASRQSA
jgi:hypothetical protein